MIDEQLEASAPSRAVPHAEVRLIVRVTDFHDQGSAVQPREVFINAAYVVAMEPWGTKYKVFVGRSLEYVVSAEDARRLANARG